jgi:hypothetical protein
LVEYLLSLHSPLSNFLKFAQTFLSISMISKAYPGPPIRRLCDTLIIFDVRFLSIIIHDIVSCESITKHNLNPTNIWCSQISLTGILWERYSKRKRTNNDLQNITQNTEDWATRTPLKTGGESRCSGRVISFCSTFNTRRFTVKRHEHQEIIRGTGI